jgi:nucleoside recognition membrane protein YjiH
LVEVVEGKRDMFGYRSIALLLVAGAAVAVLAWAAVVPDLMSRGTFGTVVALVFGLGTVALMTLRGGRSTTSVAHVIHDAETAEAGTRAGAAGGR